MINLPYRATGFGLCWHSDIALTGFDATAGNAVGDDTSIDPPIAVYCVDRLADRIDGHPINAGYLYRDGLRFAWEDEVVFDMIDGIRIAYRPGVDWTGTMPVSFYSTLVALTAVWRGLVPLHACAVELDGRAVLIAGPAGAGKSTLTAGLLELGAGFIADDLTILSIDGNGGIRVPRGRPTIRLHPDSAAALDTVHAEAVVGDPRGKWMARPRRRQTGDAPTLGAIVMLDNDVARTGSDKAVKLLGHIFRRQRLTALPMRAKLVSDVLALVTRVPMLFYPAQDACTEVARRRRAEDLLAQLRLTLDQQSLIRP